MPKSKHRRKGKTRPRKPGRHSTPLTEFQRELETMMSGYTDMLDPAAGEQTTRDPGLAFSIGRLVACARCGRLHERPTTDEEWAEEKATALANGLSDDVLSECTPEGHPRAAWRMMLTGEPPAECPTCGETPDMETEETDDPQAISEKIYEALPPGPDNRAREAEHIARADRPINHDAITVEWRTHVEIHD